MSLNIASWNVNGLRARLKKGYMGEFLLNQKKRSGRHELSLGDLIQAAQGSETIRLIQVSNG